MLKAGDKIAHPQHGAGTVEGTEERLIDGKVSNYYVFRPAMDDIKILIPVGACGKTGIRPVCTREEAEKLLREIEALPQEDSKGKSQRYRENRLRVSSGNLLEVARAAKYLTLRDKERSLPMAEKKMLLSARRILDSELAFALDIPCEEIGKRIDALISHG